MRRAGPLWPMTASAWCVAAAPHISLPLQTCMPHAPRRRVCSNPMQALLKKLWAMGVVVRTPAAAAPLFVAERSALSHYHHTRVNGKLLDEVGGIRAAVCVAALRAVDEALFAGGGGTVQTGSPNLRLARLLEAMVRFVNPSGSLKSIPPKKRRYVNNRKVKNGRGGRWAKGGGRRGAYPVADFLEVLFEICGVVEKGQNSKKFAVCHGVF